MSKTTKTIASQYKRRIGNTVHIKLIQSHLHKVQRECYFIQIIKIA